MKVLRKTKGPIFLIRSEVHVPSPLTMKTGRGHFAVSRSNTTADGQTYGHHCSRVLIECRNNTHKKKDTTITSTSNISFPHTT
jgi:hypothetical protein